MKAFFLSLLLASCVSVKQEIQLQPTVMTGNRLKVSCLGRGLSAQQARSDAFEQCSASGAEFLAREVSIQEEYMETSQDTYTYRQISSKRKVSKLDCKPISENLTYSNDGTQVISMLQCEFDLTKSQDVSLLDNKQLADKPIPIAMHQKGKLFLTTLPKCKTVQVIGANTRIVPCAENHLLTIEIMETDRQILIEKPGYLPKKENLTGGFLQTLHVILTPETK